MEAQTLIRSIWIQHFPSKRARRLDWQIWQDFHQKKHLPSADVRKIFHKGVLEEEVFAEENQIYKEQMFWLEERVGEEMGMGLRFWWREERWWFS